MSLQFVHPLAWFFAALLVILVILYLLEHKRRHVEVPSLLLWEPVPVTTARRFRPDWLFLLQCLLLLALIAGLSNPYVPDKQATAAPNRTIFVIDRSASMQAREGRDTRFDLARGALRARLDAVPPDHEVMLIAAAQPPSVLVQPTVDREAMRDTLDALEPVDTRADLDAALTLAQRALDGAGRDAHVELFSDTRRERLSPAWKDTVSLFPVGETDHNVAIDGVQVFQGRFDDPRAAHAFVGVRNFAHHGVHGVLTLQVDDTLLGQHGFSLPPRAAQGFPVSNFPGAGILRAALQVDDALGADNQAFALVRPPRPLKLLVVSDVAAVQREFARIAHAAPNVQIETVSTADYAGTAGADIAVFHRFAPPLPMEASSLYIAPTATTGPFPSRGQQRRVQVVDWQHSHPVLRDLRLDRPVPLASAQVLDVPPWAEVLLSSRGDGRNVPLVVAGLHQERRHAALAFDLAVERLLAADHTDLLLLVLSLLDWLAPTENGVHIVPTGTAELLPDLPELPVHITDPRGHETTLAADQVALVDAQLAGEYRVAVNGTHLRVFANLLDPDESDIGRPPAAPSLVAAPGQDESTAIPARGGFGWWLYAVGALLLLLEWIAAVRTA
jgi:hypothetical protein